MAEEGIFEKDDDGDAKQKRNHPSTRSDDRRPADAKKPRSSDMSESVLEKEGVNMRAVADGTPKEMSKIFPSYNRGRGRGGKP